MLGNTIIHNLMYLDKINVQLYSLLKKMIFHEDNGSHGYRETCLNQTQSAPKTTSFMS
jgi:hypothetical protein